MDTQQIIVLAGGLVLLLALTVLPQWRARRRREQQRAGLAPGAEVMTVGGIYGRVTRVESEDGRIYLEISPGVEIAVIPAAISRTVESREPPHNGDGEVEASA